VIKDLWWRYRDTQNWALKGINLDVKKGEFLVIMGENGAGKTSLCLSLNGIVPHNYIGEMKGEVKVQGMDTRQHKPSELSRKVAMVSQNPESQFIRMRVDDEVAFGPENLNLPVEEIKQRIDQTLKLVRMDRYKLKHPRELSGGQKQRVAIATALALRPEVLVLDEPTSQLDPAGKVELFSTVDALRKEYGITTVMVEHRSEEVMSFADRVLLLHEGEIKLEGKPEKFFENCDFLLERGVYPPQIMQLDYLIKNDESLGVKSGGSSLTLDGAYANALKLLKNGRK
jgi:energy-coupling factor transport system ATP-binding protein